MTSNKERQVERPCFIPDGARTRRFYEDVKARLADSFRHIGVVIEGNGGSLPPGFAGTIETLAEPGLVSPEVFALHYQLVLAVQNEESRQIEETLAWLARNDFERTSVECLAYSEASLGTEKLALYRAFVDVDPEFGLALAEPDAETLDRIAPATRAACRLLEEGAPELWSEISATTAEIILASTTHGAEKAQFHGASSVYVWGALFMNAPFHTARFDVAETIVHESSHGLLFGLSLDEHLVENDDEERYRSPLRDDPRPMDGILHATYVIARMHYGLSTLLQSGLLTGEEIEAGKGRLKDLMAQFRDGRDVIDQHGHLSPTGARVIAAASEYMSAAA